MQSNDLGGHEHDTQRDDRLHGRGGTCTNPSVAAASVTLCATVKAVTVFTSRRQPRTSRSSAEHEQQVVDARQDVLDAEHRYVRATSARVGAAATTNEGADGVSRATCVVPSSRSRRTRTSVIGCGEAGDADRAAGQSARRA